MHSDVILYSKEPVKFDCKFENSGEFLIGRHGIIDKETDENIKDALHDNNGELAEINYVRLPSVFDRNCEIYSIFTSKKIYRELFCSEENLKKFNEDLKLAELELQGIFEESGEDEDEDDDEEYADDEAGEDEDNDEDEDEGGEICEK
jgi:hypothetical protein